LIRELDNGQSERLGTFGEGTVIGEVSFYSDVPYIATAVTDRPCRLYRLSHEILKEMAETNPELLAACHQLIAQLLADRLVQSDERAKLLLQ
jgi:SulP family sulfate permease